MIKRFNGTFNIEILIYYIKKIKCLKVHVQNSVSVCGSVNGNRLYSEKPSANALVAHFLRLFQSLFCYLV